MGDPEVIANVVTLVLLFLSFGFKTLIFRRTTLFGTSLALLAAGITVLWLGALLGLHWPFFLGFTWRIVLRIILIAACLGFLNAARHYYGGTKQLLAEASLGLLEIMQDFLYLTRLGCFLWCDTIGCRIQRKEQGCRHWCKRPRRSRLRSPSSDAGRGTRTS